MRYRTWPNAISLLRLPLAAAFFAVETALARGAILAAGALSDFVDGWLARRTDQRSRSGEILDGAVDKIFILAALVSFVPGGRLELWQLLILLARDAYITAAFLVALALRMPIRFRARYGGKVVTVLQLAAVLVLIVRPRWIDGLVVLVGIASIYAIVDYTRVALESLRNPEERA